MNKVGIQLIKKSSDKNHTHSLCLFIFKTMAASVVATPLNELDVMLQDLSKGHYAASGASANDYSVYSDFGSFTKASPKASPGPTSPSPASPPSRPTPPKSYKVA